MLECLNLQIRFTPLESCLWNAETPTWRKAGGDVDLCNACGVRKSSKLRSRQHPPLPIKPVAGPLLQTQSLPVMPKVVLKMPEPLVLPKANSMPSAVQQPPARQSMFDRFLNQASQSSQVLVLVKTSDIGSCSQQILLNHCSSACRLQQHAASYREMEHCLASEHLRCKISRWPHCSSDLHTPLLK